MSEKIDLAARVQPNNKVAFGTYGLAVSALLMRVAEGYGIALTASEAIAVVTVVYPVIQWWIPDAPRPARNTESDHATNPD